MKLKPIFALLIIATLASPVAANQVDDAIAYLKDPEWGLRAGGAASLGNLGDPRAVDPLIEALSDEVSMVRLHAASSLVKLGRPEYLDRVILALKDEEKWVRGWAATHLGDIGDPRALFPLREALQDEDPWVRSKASEALGKIAEAPADDEVAEEEKEAIEEDDELSRLLYDLEHGDPGEKVAAALSLGEIGDPRAVGPLVEALKDVEWEVRGAAVIALAGIGDDRAVDPVI
ncbi:MAG: HEAT repeat domain-containing protein, partial [Methanothrix sp.]